MLCLNKYCFFSDVINNKVLIYNSSSETYAIVEESDFIYINNFLKDAISEKKELVERLHNHGFLVRNDDNCFNVQSFNQKIIAMRNCMKTMAVFNIYIDDGNDLRWTMDNSTFIQCIEAIKLYCYTIKAKTVKIILLYNKLNDRVLEHLNTIKQHIVNIDSHIVVTFVKSDDREEKDLIVELAKKNIEVHYVQDNNSKDEHTGYLSYEKYLADKSMYHYFNILQNDTMFFKGINSFDFLCPCLMEHYFSIEYGIIIKKCSHQKNDQSNVIGIIDDNKMIFNLNANDYILSIDRLDEKCKSCCFVYLCMGQNCRVCSNSKVISCMPMRRIINRSLNYKLREYLSEESMK